MEIKVEAGNLQQVQKFTVQSSYFAPWCRVSALRSSYHWSNKAAEILTSHTHPI